MRSILSCAPLILAVGISIAPQIPGQGATNVDVPQPPSLEARLNRAEAISRQDAYRERSTLLEDVVWSEEGNPVLKNGPKQAYEKLDTRTWQVVTLASFESLARALRSADGVDLRSVDRDVRSPIGFRDSGVVLANGAGHWLCGFMSDRCEKLAPAPTSDPSINWSADRRSGLTLDNGNLHLTAADSPSPWKLTDDGSDTITYGSLAERPWRGTGTRGSPRVAWSGDGRYAAVVRRDQTGVEPAALTDWLPNGEYGRRAEHVPFLPRAFFGDARIGTRSLYIVDTVARKLIPVPDSTSRVVKGDAIASNDLQFGDDGRRVYFIAMAEDFRSARLIEFDFHTLASRTVLTEQPADGGFALPDGRYGGSAPAFKVMTGRNAVVWYSERDGFGHLYLYRLDSGKLVRQLTRGSWNVLAVHRVSGSTLYFSGTSGESSPEPYNRQLYSVDVDTGKLERHTDPGSDHTFAWSATGDLFVQSSASMSAPAALGVRSIGHLKRPPVPFGVSAAQALAEIRTTSYQAPTRFKVRSTVADRVVFGTIHRPSWAAPERALPVIENIYPGNCCMTAPWSFPHARADSGNQGFASVFDPQALAELGFVVVITAGPGSPLRGRAYHQAQRGEGYWDADSLQTHMDVLKQLAVQHPTMDLTRVGIYGHSGGGYAAARAILKYPEFYDVAVAMAGNHDRRLYNAGWAAFYGGQDPLGADARTGPETVTLAGNLRGHLLLMHGDVDSSVLIDSTMQLAGALQRAQKKFDMQVVIGGDHAIDEMDFTRRYYWSYFLEHLRGDRTNVDLACR